MQDLVMRNPPYQDESVGEQKTYTAPVYNLFLDESCKISNKVELIHPARFLFNAGSTPKKWNEKMLNSEHFKIMNYFHKSADVFPGTDIKGGVAITYYDNSNEFDPIGIFTPFEELNHIYKKVIKSKGFKSIEPIVFTRTAFRLTDLFHQENPDAIHFLSKGHPYDMATNILDTLDPFFYEKKPDDGHEYIQILGRKNNRRTLRYIRRDYVNNGRNLDYWKVIIPAANGSGALGEVLSTPVIGQPVIGHTESFISLGKFLTKNEAIACDKYIKSKFVRALLGVLKVTQHNPPEKWKFVPLQDFSGNSDIDWSKSIPEIDQQLYKKYELSSKEIDFIETHIKEMD